MADATEPRANIASPEVLQEFVSTGRPVHAWQWLDRNGEAAPGPCYGGMLRLTKAVEDRIVSIRADIPDLVAVAHLLPKDCL